MSYSPPSSQVVRTLRVRYLILLDIPLICLSVLFAISARLEDSSLVWPYLRDEGWILLVLALLIRPPLYFYFNLYNRLWRYASTGELFCILKAGLLAPLIIGLLNFGLLPMLGMPFNHSGSIWLLEAVFSLGMLTGLRFLLRILRQHEAHSRQSARPTTGVPTLIIGAGDAGAMILREINRNPHLGMKVIGFVDDDASKHSFVLLDVPVLGDRSMMPTLIREHGVRQVIIAMPTAPGKVIREVMQLCESADIRPRIVPRLDAMMGNTGSASQLRAVDIEDLLRREPVATDTGRIRELLQHKRVMVTGGGGSIGSELCRQILRCHPAELVILGHGENSIFEIEQELSRIRERQEGDTRIITRIADIRMVERIFAVFQELRPEVVFHAAAHKHVPLMEANPVEAVTNNILGTRNVLQAAESVGVSRFIMVSSDKAVNPTNIMGASKRAAELLVLDAAQRTGKAYGAVRFGNVLGSRGSVVLTFKNQIALGGPVTVTHPEMRRFFMTIPEAVQLLLQAAILGQGGEVFMLDMGEPVRIVDLATDLIRLSGLEVERDIDIVFSGMRPGDKLYEDLFLPGEAYYTTEHPKIRIAANAARAVPDCLHTVIANLEDIVPYAERDTILKYLSTLVPEYHTQDTTAPMLHPPNNVASKNGDHPMSCITSVADSVSIQANN